MRGYILIRLVNHCAHFAPIIALTLQRQPSYRVLPHHNLCALWVFSSMRGSLTGAPEAFGANFATIFVFSSAKSPHGYPRVTWFHWVKPHRLLAAIHVYVQMCEIHGISWNKKKATTNCTLHSGHHRILSHVLLQCLVNPSTAPRVRRRLENTFLKRVMGYPNAPKKKNNRWIDFETTVLNVFMSLNFAFLES